MFGLGLYQISLICENTTSIESMQRDVNIREFRRRGEVRNMYMFCFACQLCFFVCFFFFFALFFCCDCHTFLCIFDTKTFIFVLLGISLSIWFGKRAHKRKASTGRVRMALVRAGDAARRRPHLAASHRAHLLRYVTWAKRRRWCRCRESDACVAVAID